MQLEINADLLIQPDVRHVEGYLKIKETTTTLLLWLKKYYLITKKQEEHHTPVVIILLLLRPLQTKKHLSNSGVIILNLY